MRRRAWAGQLQTRPSTGTTPLSALGCCGPPAMCRARPAPLLSPLVLIWATMVVLQAVHTVETRFTPAGTHALSFLSHLV